MRGRRAALQKNALTPDPMDRAREAKRALFAAAVDPDGKLDPAERAKRADRLFRAWHTDLAYQSSRKRRGLTSRKLVLVEWLEAATRKAAAAPTSATALEEKRDVSAPAPKEERRVADVPARS
jgi:hypothetical protein